MPTGTANRAAAQKRANNAASPSNHCNFSVLSVSFVSPFFRSVVSVVCSSPMRYLHYDVFTSTPFKGNQLAVYPDPPRDIAVARMQRIAAEMNFSRRRSCSRQRGRATCACGSSRRARSSAWPGSDHRHDVRPGGRRTIPPGREKFVFELGRRTDSGVARMGDETGCRSPG